MIVGDLTAEARNQLEKARQDIVPLHRQKFQKKTEIIILPDDGRSQKGDQRGATGVPGGT